MFFLFVQCTLMGSIGISFDRWHYCIFLFVYAALICFILCFVCVFLKSLVICRTSLPQYVKVACFVMWCLWRVCMFCLCGCGSVFLLGLCYVWYFVVCFYGVLITMNTHMSEIRFTSGNIHKKGAQT
jgi:hypothetical protein